MFVNCKTLGKIFSISRKFEFLKIVIFDCLIVNTIVSINFTVTVCFACADHRVHYECSVTTSIIVNFVIILVNDY